MVRMAMVVPERKDETLRKPDMRQDVKAAAQDCWDVSARQAGTAGPAARGVVEKTPGRRVPGNAAPEEEAQPGIVLAEAPPL